MSSESKRNSCMEKITRNIQFIGKVQHRTKDYIGQGYM